MHAQPKMKTSNIYETNVYTERRWCVIYGCHDLKKYNK